jgi:hypothetical protein
MDKANGETDRLADRLADDDGAERVVEGTGREAGGLGDV